MQHKFCCENPIGKNWTTWKRKWITPTHPPTNTHTTFISFDCRLWWIIGFTLGGGPCVIVRAEGSGGGGTRSAGHPIGVHGGRDKFRVPRTPPARLPACQLERKILPFFSLLFSTLFGVTGEKNKGEALVEPDTNNGRGQRKQDNSTVLLFCVSMSLGHRPYLASLHHAPPPTLSRFNLPPWGAPCARFLDLVGGLGVRSHGVSRPTHVSKS